MITAIVISILISIFGKKDYIRQSDSRTFADSYENLLAKIKNCKTSNAFIFLSGEVNKLRKKYCTKLPYGFVSSRISELQAELLNSRYKK